MNTHRNRQTERTTRTPQMILRLPSPSTVRLDPADEQKLISALAALLRSAGGRAADLTTKGGVGDGSQDPR